MVARLPWAQEVVGSNPASPTSLPTHRVIVSLVGLVLLPMKTPPPTEDTIKRLFSQVGLEEPRAIRKSEIGFSNHIYRINDRYVLKVGKSGIDEEPLQREIYLCQLLTGKVPTPRIVAFGTSDELVAKHFVVYDQLRGDNLYARWHLLSEAQRRDVVRQICGFLRAINETPYRGFAERFGLDVSRSWREKTYARIVGYLDKAAELGHLSPDMVTRTRDFLECHMDVLQHERMALTYWDAHFDNFLISGTKVVGMLDFEGTDISSIDYVLQLVARMVREPCKYASSHSEPFVQPEHYAHLMEWYGEFYPELFAFPEMDTRLAIYTIEHAVEDIYHFPEGEAARRELARCVG